MTKKELYVMQLDVKSILRALSISIFDPQSSLLEQKLRGLPFENGSAISKMVANSNLHNFCNIQANLKVNVRICSLDKLVLCP